VAANIVITGFMGTGKSSVGRLVAERLGRTFVDMDLIIEEREGRSIAEIFATEGEPYFRATCAESWRPSPTWLSPPVAERSLIRSTGR